MTTFTEISNDLEAALDKLASGSIPELEPILDHEITGLRYDLARSAANADADPSTAALEGFTAAVAALHTHVATVASVAGESSSTLSAFSLLVANSTITIRQARRETTRAAARGRIAAQANQLAFENRERIAAIARANGGGV
ncbi:MAG: hypothetical protein RBT62_11425 [Spirochaetia bacterium]|jgi:hypothetical protein|nr:hypothetical protein [Spirochaetia bacterium]